MELIYINNMYLKMEYNTNIYQMASLFSIAKCIFEGETILLP